LRILPLPFEHTADIPLVDLSGWYETAGQSEPSGRPLIETMQLNQAGDHVEGWMYDGQLRRWDLVGSLDITSYDPASGPPTAPTFRFGATRSRNGSDTGGSIELIPVLDRWADDFAIRVSFGGAIYAMVRRSREAMVSPVLVLAAAGASVPADMEAYMARLHSLSEQGIGRAIALLVSEIEQMTAGFTSWSVAIMLTFDRVKTQLEDDGIIEFNSDFTPVDTPMLRRFRAEAIRGLIQTPIPSANGTDGWTQLLRIFASTGASSANLQTLLGAGAGGGHAYTFQTAGVGIQGEGSLGLKFEAGGFQILCPVEHLSTCAPPGIDPASHAWSALYTGQILQASWGPGGIEGALNFITASGSNDLSTSYAWAPEDFAPSVFGAFGASVSVSAYYGVGGTLAPPVPPINIFGVPITGTQGEGYVFINRYGGIGYGASTGWSASVGIGITATGVNPSASIGPTIGVLQAQIDNTTAPPAVPIATPPLQVTLNDAVAQGFAVDSADLLPQTRDLLLRFIAQYRGVFESPSAFVQIEGDASPTGSEPYNESLSWRRALAVYAFIRSALTAPPSDEWSREQHALVLPDNRVYLVAYGETRARRDGVDDGVEDDDWRRVKITLNDRVMVVL
ncbi:MAG: OmpA family protein, partial [Vicinamibacterales bacterium]